MTTTQTRPVFSARKPQSMFEMMDGMAEPTVEPRESEIIKPDGVQLYMYLHGDIQDRAGFDIPYIVEGQFEVKRHDALPVLVELPGSEQVECELFSWDTGCDMTGLTTGKKIRRWQGLIVSITDKESMVYARQCICEERKFL